jgi:hypothetical protein
MAAKEEKRYFFQVDKKKKSFLDTENSYSEFNVI